MVSVILPTYNAAEVLPAAIASIMEQTETDLELIVVDDGSTDNTPAILEAVNDPRLRAIRIEHAGIVAAINTGIAAADGEYIARMDADDISFPDRLQCQREYLDTHPDVGLVSCRVEYGGDEDTQAGYARHVQWTNELLSFDDIETGRFIESPFAHPSVMFRKALVDTRGGYRDGPFPEDYELWLRWLDAGVRMEKLPQVLLRWNDPPQRLSRTQERYSIDAFYEVRATYLARWLARHNPFHPHVWVWGGSRLSRQRANMMTAHDVEIAGYIDVDRKKTGRPVRDTPRLHYTDMPGPDAIFVVSYVAKLGAREQITDMLNQHGFVQGTNYMHAS